MKLNNYEIHPEHWFLLDHTPLTINIIIKEKFISRRKHIIIKNSKEESEFMEDFTKRFGSIDIIFITDKTALKSIVQKYANIAEATWN